MLLLLLMLPPRLPGKSLEIDDVGRVTVVGG